MATYNLNSTDLLTLLQSVVQPSTEAQILTILTQPGQPPLNQGTVDFTYEPPGGFPNVQDDTIAPGTRVDVITSDDDSTVRRRRGRYSTSPRRAALSSAPAIGRRP